MASAAVAPGRVHLLYGLAGSGKSTHARHLAATLPAVRFTLDEWMIRLHPDLAFDSAAYGDATDPVRELIWSVAEQVLRTGVDVVLDWNSWSVQRRAWAVERARSLGAPVLLHQITTVASEADRRAARRHASGAAYAHPVTPEGNRHLAALLEVPSTDEGLEILTV